MQKTLDKLTILHFNDVYNLEEGSVEPVGGVARFKTALDSFKDLDPLTLFSGDLFQPSLLGTMYNGEQMIKPAIDFKIDVACFGNHEFDLDVDILTEYIKKTNIPWLLSNVVDVHTKKPLCAGLEYYVLTKHDLKIGFVGLAEKDWLHIVNSVDEEDIIFEDYLHCANRLTKLLREEHKCDLVIALTHMRTYNDIKLAEEFTGFDLILGGHDHVNFVKEVNGTYIIKSGSDFREFNKIIMTFINQNGENKSIPNGTQNGHTTENKNSSHPKNFTIDVETIYVTKKFEADPSLKSHTDYYLDLFQKSMELPMGYSLVDLETRFDKIRHGEQNITNFIADIMRFETESDCALLNSGTIRSSLLFPRGILKMGDIRLMLPYADLVMQLELTGEQLLTALENGVSKYPALEGRFPGLSGVSFTFDPKREPMKRILFDSIRIRNGPLDLKEKYTIAAKQWLLGGKDGYDVFTQAKITTDESIAEELHSLIKRFFEIGHDPEWVELFRADRNGQHSPKKHMCHKKLHFYEKMKPLISDIVMHEGSQYVAISPKIDGRINVL